MRAVAPWCAAGLALALAQTVIGQSEEVDVKGVRENAQHVDTWNAFAEALLAVHRDRTSRLEIVETSRAGGYGDVYGGTDFFLEVEYRDAANGRLLSRIRWERENPTKAHVIEVNVHDDSGRVVRDYAAAFLPRFRNAPYQTLINLHDYNEGLHAFRQFDASGERLHEQCRGHYFGERVNLAFEYHELPGVEAGLQNPAYGEIYSACFSFIAASADGWLDPRVEIASRGRGESIGKAARDLVDLAAFTSDNDDPGNAPVYVRRAQQHFHRQEFGAAIAALNRAIALQPQLDSAWFWRGMALGRAQRFEEAIADLGVFIERNPDSSLAHTKRGIRHFWRGDYPSAERDLRRAIELDAANAEAHDDLGVILARRGDLDNAIAHFNTTVRLDPSYQKGFHNLALTHFMRGEHDVALEAVDAGLRLAEDRASLRLRANILRKLGRTGEARAAERKAVNLPEGNWSETISVGAAAVTN